MAIRVKDLASSANKWNNNASSASAEYAANAVAAGAEWATNTAQAATTYGQAVTSGNIVERFRRGVQKAGAEKYTRKIASLGAGRYSTGVADAQDDWEAGFQPYHQVISGLSLPARRPRGDAGNIDRVRAVTTALHARRIANLG